MIDSIETLMTLKKLGTMGAVGTHLRISQSAVSKRISSFEHECGKKLIAKLGRRVALTPDGERILELVSPLLREIRTVINQKSVEDDRKLTIGISESILSSWGPKKLQPLLNQLKIDATLHCHRSPVVMEKVEAGYYDIGICAGDMAVVRSLHSENIGTEEMVMIGARKAEFRSRKKKTFISIEKKSATWKSLQKEINVRGLMVTDHLESFFAVAQMARSGFGVGIVPRGVAEVLASNDCMKSFKPKISRPIQVVFKKSKLEVTLVNEFLDALSGVKIS